MTRLIKKVAETNSPSLSRLRAAMPFNSPPSSRVVYHYCTPEAFFSIITSKVLWLSEADSTNDSSEIKWAKQVIDTVISNLVKAEKKDRIDNLRREFQPDLYRNFLASFSQKDDVLSQWRGYGDDGHGVAIGC